MLTGEGMGHGPGPCDLPVDLPLVGVTARLTCCWNGSDYILNHSPAAAGVSVLPLLTCR